MKESNAKKIALSFISQRIRNFKNLVYLPASLVSGELLRCFLLGVLSCWITTTYAQEQDSIGRLQEVQEILPEKPIKKKSSFNNYWKENYPSPKKAITLAIIPGLGQIYNKKYWKLPLVYGALGGVVYSIDWNTKRYEVYRKAYDAKTNEKTIYEDTLPRVPAAAVKSRRDSFDKNRQLSWIGLIGFYLISAGDAFVDAHLKDFNVDDDISFQPTIQTDRLQPTTIGISLKININK